jgi:hypothetical protein
MAAPLITPMSTALVNSSTKNFTYELLKVKKGKYFDSNERVRGYHSQG